MVKKERLSYIDVAKGILISLVVVWHTTWLAETNGIDNIVFNFVEKIGFIYSPFFMAAFFFITGYCTNFEKKYSQFLLTDLRTLLWPSITLVFIGGGLMYLYDGTPLGNAIRPYHLIRFISCHWFLPAMFWAKQIHYFLKRFKYNYLIYIPLSFLGVYLSDKVLDYWWMEHSFMFVIFIYLGHIMRGGKFQLVQNPKVFIPLYVIYIVITRLLTPQMPAITSGVGLEIWQLPQFIISATLGSLVIIHLSKKIAHAPFLEYLGKNSLVVYCLHFTLMSLFYKTFQDSLNTTNLQASLLALFAMYVFVIEGCTILSFVLTQRYTKWIIGKK